MTNQETYQEYLQQVEDGQDTPEAIFAQLEKDENDYNLAISLQKKVVHDLNKKGYEVSDSDLDYFGWTIERVIDELNSNQFFSSVVMNATIDIINKIAKLQNQ